MVGEAASSSRKSFCRHYLTHVWAKKMKSVTTNAPPGLLGMMGFALTGSDCGPGFSFSPKPRFLTRMAVHPQGSETSCHELVEEEWFDDENLTVIPSKIPFPRFCAWKILVRLQAPALSSRDSFWRTRLTRSLNVGSDDKQESVAIIAKSKASI
ncbi:MAG: hypothetical protein JKY26_05130 [Pseudomonas sp.]|nr:hypothetical protein [Pseudomonas sp.]